MTVAMEGQKVIFVTFVKRAEHFERRFFIREFMARGLHIELWDLSRIFGTARDADGSQEPPYVKQYRRRAEVAAALESSRAATFVMLFDLEYRFLWIYRLLSKRHCTLHFFSWGAFPPYRVRGTKAVAPAILEPGRLYRGLVLRLYRALGLVKPFDVVLYAGTRARDIVPGARRYISVNLPDVEEYCDLQGDAVPADERLLGGKYAVFLDCSLPFHPDFRINNLKTIDAEKYRIAINRFFGRLEQELGMPVVIAAHPKAQYPEGYFESRVLIMRRTARLVMDCSLVISHYSTSTTYAVLWKKPIVFIYSDEMEAHQGAGHMVPITIALAKALNMPLYNIDHLPKCIAMAPVDDAVYAQYRMNYVTTNSSCESRNRNIIFAAFAASAGDKQHMKREST